MVICAAACLVAGCKPAPPPPPPPQAMPVQVAPVTLSPVPNSDTYVATIKSRRSATMQPQVDGNLVKIFVKSGDVVKAGQVLMRIDPLKQMATVQSQQGTQAQKKALYDYTQIEVERQRKLFEAGVVSRDAYDQAIQAFQNAKADYESNAALTDTQKQQLAYYDIRAPFAGIVGDVPVHLGDYVSTTTVLTTVDENADLEAYIYIPTERATYGSSGTASRDPRHLRQRLSSNRRSAFSPRRSIMACRAFSPKPRSRAPPTSSATSSSSRRASPGAPRPRLWFLCLPLALWAARPSSYLASPKGDGYVAHQVPVTLGETVGNTYPVLGGLKPGDKVITSGLQFLQEGAPVKPLG